MSNSHFHSNRLIIAFIFLTLASAGVAGAQATLSKVFSPNTIGPGGVSTITFTVTNGSASPMTGLAFTDVLPTVPGDVDIAAPANASTDCLEAVLSAPDGGDTITFSGGGLGAGDVCTVTVDVTASTPGAHTNPAVMLTFSELSGDPPFSSPVDLTVDASLPGFSKSFAPSSVPLGGRSTLTFTVDNTANASGVLNLDFTDNLPGGMVIADPANATTTCGTALIPPTLTAAAGTGVIFLDANGVGSFPAVAAGETCTVSVDVVATGTGMLHNVSGELLADFVSAGKASDTLEVTVTSLALTKSFTDDPVPPGSPATLEFTIDNFDRNFSATGVAFTDDLTALVPALAGLTFSSLLSNDCGGSVSGVGGTTMGLSGGTVAPESACTLRVSLTVPAGATPGSYTNTTSTVTATVDGSLVVGNMASDDLYVEPVPVLTKEFLEVGTLDPDPVIDPGDDVVLRFTITNTSTTSTATDIAFVDELTDGSGGVPPDLTSGFLPFPVTVVSPALPASACGGSVTLVIVGADRQGLSLTGGSLAAAGMSGDSCTFDVTVTVPEGMAPGVYLNTTEEPIATVDGATRIGEPASDTLTVIAAPSLTKEFTDDPVAPGSMATLEFTLSYPADASGDATGITFTDDLKFLAGLAVTGLPIAEVCDPDGPGGEPGTGTLSESGGILTFMGGELSPGEICAFSVALDVPVGASPGTYANTTSGVGATVGGMAATSPAASDSLKVAGLVFTKEFLGDPVIAGDTVTLRFTIDNIHPTDDAAITFFTDNLAADLPGLAATGPPSLDTCGGSLSGTTFLIYTGGSVMSGTDCMIEVEVMVPLVAADGTYANITSSLSANQGGAVTIDPATDELTVDSNLLQLTKEFTDDPVAPGDTVNLRFTFTNLDAANPASAIAFTDDLDATLSGLLATGLGAPVVACGGTVSTPDGGTTIEFSGGSLTGGETCIFDVSVDVPGDAAAGVYPNTTSDLAGTIGGFAVSGDAASDDLEVLQLLSFSKSFDGPTTATGMATLTFTITNPGGDTATGISFSDNLDDVISGLIAIGLPAVPCGAGSSITGIGFLTFAGGELPPLGGTCSFDVDVLVPATATAGTFPNTTSDLLRSGLKVADPATADLVIEPPPTFAKAFMPDAILAGGVSTLRFTIDNTASALGSSSLGFTDNLPAGVAVATPSVTSNTCGGTLTADAGAGTINLAGGSVGAGASCTIDVSVSSIVSGAHVNVTGDLTSSSGDSGTATDTLTVSPAADLSVTKSDGVTSATPGGSVTYTIVVANSGPSADPSVTLSDAFPSPPLTCTYTSVPAGGATGNTAAGAGDLSETLSMPAGSSVTYTASCTIDSDATGTLSNTASITPSITDTNPGNNSATDSDTVLVPSADLAISKTDGVDSAVPGQTTLTYTIVASNLGLSDDPSATVADVFPADLSCTYTSVAAGGATGNTAAGSGDLAETLSMPAGSSVTYSASCSIDAAATGTLSNTATITASVTDPVPGNNSATDDDTVLGPEADLSIVKTASEDLVVNPTFTYVLEVTNQGPSAADGVEATDVLPAGVVFDSSADGCTEVAGTVTCAFGTVAEGATVTRTFVVALDFPWPASIINTATVSSSISDPNPGNDDSTVETAIDAVPPEITEVASTAGPLVECDTVRDPITSLSVTIVDDLAPGTSAGDPANYLLVGAGPDADFSTGVCAGGAAGDDVPIEIVALSLTTVDPLTVTARLGLGSSLDAGLYRLLVCDTITDAAGNPLDGDGDMTPGGDFVVPFFRSDPFNLFANGHFDDCPVTLDPWSILVSAPNAVLPGLPAVEDSEGSPFSGSAWLSNSTAEATVMAQCVPVDSASGLDIRARLRFVPGASEVATFQLACEFFEGAACGGGSLGVASEITLLEDEGGAWLSLASDLATPAGTESVRCDFSVEAVGTSSDFDLYIDGLYVGSGSVIFADGFESGNVSAWSSSIP